MWLPSLEQVANAVVYIWASGAVAFTIGVLWLTLSPTEEHERPVESADGAPADA